MQSMLKSNLMIAMVLICGLAYGQELNNPNRLRTCPKDQNARYHNCWGTATFEGGDTYVGEFKSDKQHGQGTYTWANGDKYVGEFKDDKYHGQGTFTYANGEKYVGEWKDNKRNGQGTATYTNGDKYVGEWRNGKYHGQGTKTIPGGEFAGEFKNGEPGRGTLTQADGKRIEGAWENGNFVTETKVSQTSANKTAKATDCKSAGGLECMVEGKQGLESDDFNTRLDSLFKMAEGAAVFNENFCNSVYTPQQRAAAKKRNSSSSFKVNAVPENGNRLTKISYAGQSGCTDAHTFKIDYVVRSGNSASCVISCGIGAENTCGGYVRARCVP